MKRVVPYLILLSALAFIGWTEKPPDDDVVVTIANHHWLPEDGQYSKEGDVTIYPGGVIRFKKGLSIDEAAKSFWRAVGAHAPCDPSMQRTDD